jgi:hypothetical protein
METSVIKQYRLLIPMTVEAVLVTSETVDLVAGWCKGAKLSNTNLVGVNVPTLTGVKQAYEGDYVVKKMTGDFKVLAREVFERKYVLLDLGVESR